MTPEDIHSEQIWEVLQKIKLEFLREGKQPILIRYREFQEDTKIIQTLQDEKVIKIVKNPLEYAGLYTANNPATTLTTDKIDLTEYIGNSSFIFLKILPKFDKYYKKYKKKFSNSVNKMVFIHKPIKLDLVKAEIQYRKREPITIQLNSPSIKFLALLLRNKRVVGYREIANELCLPLRYSKEEQALIQQVNTAKSELVKFLKNKVGMETIEINRMIKNIDKIGYKLEG